MIGWGGGEGANRKYPKGAEEDVMRVVVKLLNYPLFICAMVFNIPLLLLIVFEKSLHKAPFFLIANKSVINTMSAISIFYQCLRLVERVLLPHDRKSKKSYNTTK